MSSRSQYFATAAIEPQSRSLLRSAGRFLFDEAFLGFLAIVSASLTAFPLLFDVSARTDALLETAQWAIIALFGIEYWMGLAAAPSKREYILDAWRLVDAFTILIPLFTLLPGVSDFLRSSPVLRLIRLARVFTMGVRASGVVAREEKAAAAYQKPAPVEIHRVAGTAQARAKPATWDEFVQWAKAPGTEWYSISNVGPHNLSDLASATGIARDFITAHLLSASYPHVEMADGQASLFAWIPEISASGSIERNGLLLMAGDKSVLSFSRKPSSLLDHLPVSIPSELAGSSFPVRVLCQFLKSVIDANEVVVAHFERQLRDLEELPVRESRPAFFERTFRLKKELSNAQADLWRLRGVLREFSEGRSKLPGSTGGEIPLLRDLADAAEYLYETVNNTREGVLSLIELHLNVVSFEMNRVMRVLAVVSVLGLIPAVVGGLFGMNLNGNPWPLTLPQVTFGVCVTMVTCLYFFVVKGWLR
jgi:Mg2+ and Co2+ transporter CorA